jgi:hypothetical protein
MYTDAEILAYRGYHTRLIADRCVHVPTGGQRFVPPTGLAPAFPLHLERLGPWQPDPEAPHAFMRCVLGGDPNSVSDRRCFIEKTPRVYDPTLGMPPEDWRSWVPGDKGCGHECGLYAPSRKFADRLARLLGYTIEE